MVKAVRGAITARENSAEAIREASRRLLLELLRCNHVATGRILSLVFSVTRDLTRLNPAAIARELGLTDTPLFCVQEAEIDGALPRVIRVLVTYAGPRGRAPVPVYLEDARGLRPDLAEGTTS
jgi:monofunctional chorismate mutase